MFPRLFALAVMLLAGLPAVAAAACRGENIVARMPAAQREALIGATLAHPYAEGNLWLASRGEERVVLVGTYHFDDPRFAPIFARLAPVVESAARVLVEAGPEEQAALEADLTSRPELTFRLTGPTLPERMAEADWQTLARAMEERGFPPFLTAKMQPWYVGVMLGIPPCAMQEMARGKTNGLDSRIMDLATREGIEIRALEPYDTLFTLFDGVSEADQLEMIRMTLAMDVDPQDNAATMADAYFEERARLIWELSRLQALAADDRPDAEVAAEIDAMEEALIRRRNRNWLPVIEAAAREGGLTVAAFGALHLSGEEGVLALLARAGFTVERLPF
ncbi:TraB/GumN family protein [Albidovulum sp.]